MSRIQQNYLLPRLEQDEAYRELFYEDVQHQEPDYNSVPKLNYQTNFGETYDENIQIFLLE